MNGDALVPILVAVITAAGTILVAAINWRGKRLAASDATPPRENGEHAHTRDVVRDGNASLHRRFDVLERAMGAVRQSEQLGVSAQRLDDKE